MIDNSKDISEFLTRQYIDKFLSCSFPEATPITDTLNKPKLGDHLVTPRTGYDHHGIYIGKEKVIHYSGFADGLNSGPV